MITFDWITVPLVYTQVSVLGDSDVGLYSSSFRMRVINHNWPATKQRPHPQNVDEISRHSVSSLTCVS